MIAYLVTRDARYTIDRFVETWGAGLRSSIAVVPYEDLFAGAELDAATVVFSDLERLPPAERAVADAIWCELAALDRRPQLLNRPASVLSRQAFLEALHETGINDFRATALRRARRESLRFPLFVRHKDDHWALPQLIEDRAELEREIARTLVIGRLDDRLAVEFCDTRDADGLFRKYAAFVLDDRIVPRHLIFDTNWYLKTPQLLDDGKLAEEQRYLDTNPHAEQLLHAARLGGYDYGRIDYGVKNGRIQVWEINTNPMVMLAPDEYDERHLPAQEWFLARITDELARLADGPSAPYRWRGASPARAAAAPSTRGSGGVVVRAGRGVAWAAARLWPRQLTALAEREA